MSKRIFTNSELSNYQHCPQKWWFNYNQLLSPNYPKDCLVFGILIHECLDMYYSKNKDIKAVLGYIKDTIMEQIDQCSDEVKIQSYGEMLNLAQSMLQMYHQFAIINDDFEVIESENSHIVPVVTNTGRASNAFDYKFRLDQLVKRKDQLWIHEFKTALMIDKNYISNLMLDEQMSRYIWAMEKHLNKKIEGVIYSVLRKKIPVKPEILKKGGLSLRKDIDTTYDIYLNAIKEKNLEIDPYRQMLAILHNKGNTFVMREMVLRNQREKNECEERLYTLCKTLNTDAPVYKCPDRDCTWKCDYRSLCIEDTPEARSLFKKRDVLHPEYKEENNGNDCKF